MDRWACMASKEMVTRTEILRGRAASPGKATGTVRIILSERDLKRVNEGDIVVSPMTKPEYVQVMAKAGAFVTDIGGITCHAAIVAREYRKPCIVGTKQVTGECATNVLKEGSLVTVEIDGVYGIVYSGQGD